MAAIGDLRGRVILTDHATPVLNRVKSAIIGVQSLQRQAASMGAASTGVGGMGASIGAAYFLKQQFDFEKALNRTQAILNITERMSFRPLRDEIVRLAEAYPAMRTEIAKGASDLAEAGMNLSTIKAVLEGTIQGSMASGESIKTVAGGVTDIVMSMAMPFKTAAEQAESFRIVNDKLAAAATTYNQSYTMMLSGLGRAGPIARAAGVSLHDTAAMLGTLADANFKAERGGIALGTLMLRLGSPTKKARGELAAFNIDLSRFQQATGRFSNMGAKPLTDMLSEELGLSADGLSESINQMLKDPNLTRNSQNLGLALTKLLTDGLNIGAGDAENRSKIADVVGRYVRGSFSQLDMVGILREFAKKDVDKSLPFLNEVAGKYHAAKMAALISGFRSGAFDEKSLDLLRKTEGATQRFAAIMMQGFVGAVYRMSSAWDAFLDRLAESGVLDTVTGVIMRLTEGIGALAKTHPRLLEFATYAVLVAGVAAPLGFALSGIAAGVGVLVGAGLILMRFGATLMRLTGLMRLFSGAAASMRSGLAGLGAMLGVGAGAAAAGGAAAGGAGAGAVAAAAAAAAGGGLAAGAARSGVLDRLKRYSGVAARTGGYLLPGVGQAMMARDLFAAGGRLAGAVRAGGWRAGMAIPGIGPLFALAGLGLSVYSGVQTYRETGSIAEGLKQGSGLNDLLGLGKWLFGGTPANAAGAKPGGAPGPSASAAPEAAMQQTVDRMRSTLTSVDFTSEGQRIMETLAAGIRAGSAQVDAAIGDVASRMRSQINAVRLNTGPAIGAGAQ